MTGRVGHDHPFQGGYRSGGKPPPPSGVRWLLALLLDLVVLTSCQSSRIRFVQVEAVQDVMESLGAISAGNTWPSVVSVLGSVFTQECEWAQFQQLIALVGILVVAGGGLSSSGLRRAFICSSALSLERGVFHLDSLQFLVLSSLISFSQAFQPALDDFCTWWCGSRDLNACLDDHPHRLLPKTRVCRTLPLFS